MGIARARRRTRDPRPKAGGSVPILSLGATRSSTVLRPGPVEIESTSRSRAIAEVEVDQSLVRDAGLESEGFEVVHRRRVQTDGDLPLQGLRIRVPLRL